MVTPAIPRQSELNKLDTLISLAFLLIKRGDLAEAAAHLEAFLEAPPSGSEADRWVRHARHTLDELRNEAADLPDQPEG